MPRRFKLSNHHTHHYIDYQKELTYAAKKFPGFLNTDSYIINELYKKNDMDDNLKIALEKIPDQVMPMIKYMENLIKD